MKGGTIDKSLISAPTGGSGFTSSGVDPSWISFLADLQSHGIDEAVIAQNIDFIKNFVSDCQKSEATTNEGSRKKAPPLPTPRRALHGQHDSTSSTTPIPPPPPPRRTVTDAQSRKSVTRGRDRSYGVNEMSSMPSTTFGPPFDHDDADIILRSSDRVDFHVYQAILSISSPFFKSMFSLLPQPNAQGKKNPVIDLLENSKTIATILTFIYPVVSAVPEPESLDDMMDAIVAAKKYDTAIVSQRLHQKFMESAHVQDDIIAAFCAAYSRELGEACRIAAKASLKCRMSLDNVADKLPYLNGPAFYQLYKFHRACSATAAQAVSSTDLDWITQSQSTWWDLADRKCTGASRCLTHNYTLPFSRPNYWVFRGRWAASTPFHDFITRAHNVLLEHPCREAVTGHQFLAPSYKVEACDRCQLTLLGLPEFSRLLGDEIERRVSEVRHYSFTQLITQ
jgi:hypothetical protein